MPQSTVRFRSTMDRSPSIGTRASNGNADAPIAIEWQETGGPAVQAPDTSGYGMEVIRDLIPYELGGRVDLTSLLTDFAADWRYLRSG